MSGYINLRMRIFDFGDDSVFPVSGDSSWGIEPTNELDDESTE